MRTRSFCSIREREDLSVVVGPSVRFNAPGQRARAPSRTRRPAHAPRVVRAVRSYPGAWGDLTCGVTIREESPEVKSHVRTPRRPNWQGEGCHSQPTRVAPECPLALAIGEAARATHDTPVTHAGTS